MYHEWIFQDGEQNAADCSWMGSCWADKREDRDGETDGDPMGARAVEITERGSERVEADAEDGGRRMRRILAKLETRLVFQERVRKEGRGRQKTTGLNGPLPSFMRRAF